MLTKMYFATPFRQSPFQIAIVNFVGVFLILLSCQPLVGQFGHLGQQQDNSADEDALLATPIIREFAVGELESLSVQELKKLYETETENLRTACKDLRREGARYFHANSDAAPAYGKAWQKRADEANVLFQRIKEVALVLYLKTDSPDEDLAKMARLMVAKSFQDGRLGICYEVNKKLLNSFPNDQQISDDFARVAAFNNDFETAKEFAETNQATLVKFPMFDQSLFADLEGQQKRWERELELQKQEAKDDNLPRIEFETTKGKIVVELFENEAPHTVGNLVSLVEQDFYKDLIFHIVVRNYRVQGGILTVDQIRDTGYKIFDESTSEKARHIFRGSFCMAPPKRSKGASEFYINLSPEPFIETELRPIVVGRVIEGMEVVESINVTAKIDETNGQIKVLKDAQPDRIVSSKVVRKRKESVYEPKIVE